MAIADAKKRMIGRQLVDWIYLGIRTGARRSVAEYRARKVADEDAAIQTLKRAVDMPHRARIRITEWITTYNAANGAGTGQTFIGQCLALSGGVTLAEINAEVTTMENFCATLVAAAPAPYGNGSMTWDQIAASIEANVPHEANDWVFPLPAGYLDVWGE